MTQLIISLLLLFGALVVFFGSRFSDDDEVRKVGSMGSFIGFAVGLVTLITSCFTIISPGTKGVVTVFGKVDPNALPEGFHAIAPWATVHEMSHRVEIDNETHIAETSDAQTVTIQIITNWAPIGEELPAIYQKYGMDYAKKILPPAVKECVRAEIAKYKVTELIASRPVIHKAMQDQINVWLRRYGLEAREVALASIDFSDSYDRAIEAKQVQEQLALQRRNELESTKTEADMAVAKAKGLADSQIEDARGKAMSIKLAAEAEAEGLRIRGEAQADYNRRVAESLDPLLLQGEYLKKWNGQLPTYMMGDSTPLMMLPTAK